MSYEPTEYDKNWTSAILNRLQIGELWGSSYYVVRRTEEKSVKVLKVFQHENSTKMLAALIMVLKAIDWNIEHSDVFCCERARYCELYSYNDGTCCPETGGFDLPGDANRMCPTCSVDYISDMVDYYHDQAKYAM